MMNEDITQNPVQDASGTQELRRDELTREKISSVNSQQQMRAHAAQGIECPYCGTMTGSHVLCFLWKTYWQHELSELRGGDRP
jgi:hypothetical protein